MDRNAKAVSYKSANKRATSTNIFVSNTKKCHGMMIPDIFALDKNGVKRLDPYLFC